MSVPSLGPEGRQIYEGDEVLSPQKKNVGNGQAFRCMRQTRRPNHCLGNVGDTSGVSKGLNAITWRLGYARLGLFVTDERGPPCAGFFVPSRFPCASQARLWGSGAGSVPCSC